MNKAKQFQLIEWGLGGFVVAVSLLAWLAGLDFSLADLTIYDIFPLFGLVAFGLMWTHYIGGAIRRYLNAPKNPNDTYWVVSTGLVLVLIIAHPLLLNIGLIRDGFGLPPGNYSAVYGGKEMFVTLGFVSLFIFLAFELRRKFGNRSWWRYIEALQLVAMTAIFVHAIVLGGELSVEWFRLIWWLYGLSLVAAVLYNYRYDKSHKEGEILSNHNQNLS